MKEVSRRKFLKLGVGGAAIATLPFVAEGFRIVVEKGTGAQTGNPGIDERIQDTCEPEMNPKKCVEVYVPTTQEKIDSVVVAPLVEETLFRFVPSFILSDGNSPTPFKDQFTGTSGFSLSRRELMVGIPLSLFFGAAHNITDSGFNTNNIPASQTLNGMGFWYLQRKFGVGANLLAHSWNNFLAVGLKK